MKYSWNDEYLLKKRGVTKDLQESWNWVRYKVGDKMFAALCLDDKNKPYYINLKLEPEEGEFLRSQYEDIIPGFYSNKRHWNSVKPDGAVPDELLMDLLDKSYRLVLGSFPKKQQRELLGLSCCSTECKKCALFPNPCSGCNALEGRVFHVPEGKVCAIYECAVKKNKFANCAGCKNLPCEIWRATKDPNLSQEEFEENIKERVKNLNL